MFQSIYFAYEALSVADVRVMYCTQKPVLPKFLEGALLPVAAAF